MFKSVLCFVSLLTFFYFQNTGQQQYVIRGYTQGTDYTIKYYGDHDFITKKAVDSILLKIDSSMSLYKPYSLINQFNESEKGCPIDDQFAAVIRKSFEINQQTSGNFDVTVAPLVQAWGFGAQPMQRYPENSDIQLLLQLVGMDKLVLKKNNFLKKKKPGVKIDLNGIAQGYSVDVVADYLLTKGITSFVVEIGGELRIKGLKPDGSARRIGIEGPALTEGGAPHIRHLASIPEGAVTTSGNYRKFHQNGTKKITHLINPKTGYPLDNEMISVTVFAKDAMTADGYDNALMAMDVKEALQFVEAKGDLEAYFIYRRKDGGVADTLSRGFKKLIIN
ncbi:FAD:protein FMN transferase [Pedobacter sp.]|uniref:FAD:protein FMN transferase n=1 Tax=Pedobacter sp. TaxID=1411316 RepID=UPI003D7F7648